MGLGIALGAYTQEHNNQRKMRRDDETHELQKEEHAVKKEKFGWEQKDREDEQGYKSAVAELATSSPLKGYQEQLQQWQTAGGQGEQPQPPNSFQMLQWNSQFAQLATQHGRHNPELLIKNAESLDHYRKEGYVDGIRMLRKGDREGAARMFNGSGNERVDIAQAQEIEVDYRGADGRARKVKAYQLPDGTVINPDEILDALIPMEKAYEMQDRTERTDIAKKKANRPVGTGSGAREKLPSRNDQLEDLFFNTDDPEVVRQIAERMKFNGKEIDEDVVSRRVMEAAIAARQRQAQAPEEAAEEAPQPAEPQASSAPPVVAPEDVAEEEEAPNDRDAIREARRAAAGERVRRLEESKGVEIKGQPSVTEAISRIPRPSLNFNDLQRRPDGPLSNYGQQR